jgi:hypothetical protein
LKWINFSELFACGTEWYCETRAALREEKPGNCNFLIFVKEIEIEERRKYTK